MSQTYVFLPPAACAGAQAELPVQWVVDGGSESLAFSEVQAQVGGSWTLVLPVEAVTSCAVNLPTRKARWLRQALPFAVEELLAEEVELMHLALGEQLADGRHRVFAVRRSWLAGWLALCPTAPQAIAVDADLLPGQGTALLPLHGRWLLGGENVTRMALQAQDWPQLSPLCVQPQVAWCDPQHPAPQPMDESMAVAEPFVWLAQQPLRNNLAQGEFAVQSSNGQWQRWRPLLGLVGMWLVLQWGFNLAQGWHLQRQADEYAAASAALYKELFPQDSKLVNLRAQFDQHLQAGTGSGQARLLGLLAQVSGALAAEGGQVQISQVDFSEVRGDLAMQVQAAGFAELERLRERLQESGLAVQLGSASREGAGVSARVVIGG
ncbi:MAG: type II secretion system protein GspL [Pseudomonas sp.]|uniref:type II secretion system protein GspL n=1 Tax=Pseudomonas sp. TaxID=306 RepID=UPI002715D365|nr:type II secretion system protein GspL [Pseudomonas sp.]MDO9616717.1 type II secretion system protein GspL [Pseudomonas sp.]MDP2446277.1 type II secretion system protein GspL [Pseudomonas sp.]MDZ4332361.1 type II secretion system protein GspL [Pseudomonas sp.]